MNERAQPADLAEFAYLMKVRGYYLVENAASDPALLARLAAGIDRTIEEDGEAAKSGRYPHYTNPNVGRLMMTRGGEFLELLDQWYVQPYIDSLLTNTCILFNYSAVRLMPELANVVSNVHRDSHRFSPDYLLMTQVLFFVDDFTAENGATLLLPGSHHSPDPVSDDFFARQSVQITGKAGSALIFDSSLWHAGGVNRTELARRGLALVYVRSFFKQMLDVPRAIDAIDNGTLATLSPEARRLMGYDVRVPSSLEEFYLPPEKRLYKPNQG